MQRFENKIALITGGAGAIGTACGLRLAQEGAQVVLADLKFADPEKILSQFSEGKTPVLETIDVRQPQEWADLMQSIVAQFGALDVLVNNAGLISPKPAPFDELELDEWRRIFSVNVDGALLEVEALERVVTRLLDLSPEARAGIPCVGEERAHQVISGAAIFTAIVRRWPTPRMRVADRGLREGLLYGLINRDRPRLAAPAPEAALGAASGGAGQSAA